MNCKLMRLIKTAVAFAATGLLGVITCGCSSSDSAAISAIQAINDQAKADGEQPAALLVSEGDKVGTIYILSHVDELMPHVATLKSVKEVSIEKGGFTDQHVRHLRKISSLNSLVLGDSELTDAGAEELAGILARTEIENLCLDSAPITSAALSSISQVKSLMTLDLTATNVADDLTALAKMANLQWLLIRDMDLSKLSEPSLTTLAELPELRRLTVTNTGLTTEAIQRLKRAKPGLNLEAEHAEDPVEALANPPSE